MIKDPIRYIEEFAEIGADIITFHLEAAPDVNAVIEKIRACGKKVGLSIKPGTPVEELVPYLDKVDMILVMTVEPGFGGQSIIPESFDRVRAVRKMLDDRKLDTDIQVDGGICTGNVKSILEAGANVVVAGSAVFKGNISENVKGFLDIMQ